MNERCHKDWEDMASCNGGRFCNSCNKPVTDFTSWKKEDILKYYEKHPAACGRFRIEHIEPNLIPLPSPRRTISVAAFIAGISLFIGGGASAQTMDTVKTEQHIKYDRNNSTDNAITKRESFEAPPVEATPAKTNTKRYGKYFLSRRFPFIVKRRYRHWTGCPAF